MTSFRHLWKEILLRDKTDVAARLWRKLEVANGSLRRRLPAVEITAAEFMQKLKTGGASTAEGFVEEHDALPRPWKEIPKELITQGLVAYADKIVDQDFRFLSAHRFFPDKVDWHHTLDRAESWPRGHWSEIDYKKLSHLGDIKPCWEMNRHQFFPLLALAFIGTGNVKYTVALSQFIHTWCDQNVPETGVNYISGLEIGLRCISWIYAEKILRGTEALDAKTLERLHRNIWSQARHLHQYLPYTGRTGRNNHLIGEAASLAYIALSYPEFADSAKWLDDALYALWPALDEQVTPDGMHFEGSFGYHVFVTEFILILFSEMKLQRRPVPAKCQTLLEKMADAVARMRLPDGALPDVNDSDGGFALPLPLGPVERAGCLLSAATALYHRPDFRAAAGTPWNLYGHLLLGEDGAMDYRVVPDYPFAPPRLAVLKNAGLAMLRGERGDAAFIKNNPDPFPCSGHNHADLLSVLMTLDGRPVLADAGTFRYSADRGYRNALRGTQAHNTVTVDKREQATPRGNFGWTSKTQAGAFHTLETQGFAAVDADHDSFGDIRHRRLLAWLEREKAYVVIDRLSGAHAHYFEQFWHFPHDTRLEDEGRHHYRLMGPEGLRAHVRFLRESEHETHEIVYGSERNKWSFISSGYGHIESAPTLKHCWSSDLTAEHCTHRVTVFCKEGAPLPFGDIAHGVFRIGDFSVDMNVMPAKVSKA